MLNISIVNEDGKEIVVVSPGTSNVLSRDELIASINHYVAENGGNDVDYDDIIDTRNVRFEEGLKMFDGESFFDGGLIIEDVDLSKVDMTRVKNTSHMFANCSELKNVKLPPLPNVETADNMFNGCKNIEYVDLTCFNGEKPVYAENMFNSCEELKSVKISKTLAMSDNELIMENMFSNCNKLDIKNGISEDLARKIGFNEYYIYQEYKEEKDMLDIISAIKLLSIHIDPDCIWDLVDKGIADDIYNSIIENGGNIPSSIPKVCYLAKNSEEFKFIKDNFNEESQNDVYWMNLKNFAKIHNIPLKDVFENNDMDIKVKDIKNEELLEKLKSGELRACFTEFGEKKLKSTRVLFVSEDGYIRAEKELKKLDERFRRFIKGLVKLNGERVIFSDYVEKTKDEKFILSGNDSLPYVFAQTFLMGWTPNNTFLQELNKRFFNPKTGRVEIPKIKGIWKLYNSSKCWNKNGDTTAAYFNVLSILGILNDDQNIRNNGMNIFRSMTNYIPDKINVDGYTYAKEFSSLPKQEVDRNSEITIRPGIPYKAKKIKEMLPLLLKEDREIMEIVGTEEKLKKTLKKIYPLAELMDAVSIYNMPDGTAKRFMLRVMDILYVNTGDIEVAIDKTTFHGEEGKENLESFRKFTEAYAEDEDVKSHVLNSFTVHALFGGLKPEYNPDFAKFIQNHMSEILNHNSPWRMGAMLKATQENWNTIQTKREMNRRRFAGTPAWKLSFNEIERLLGEIEYTRVGEREDSKYDELAELCFTNHYSQDMFEQCCVLYDDMCLRNASSIPDVEGRCGDYTYKMLALDDPSAIFFGQMLNNCQQFGNAGESCMIHSCKSENGRVFGVFNNEGVMVAGSWVWRNGDTVCFDNVEAANNPDTRNILNAYEEAARKISENTVEGDTINKVTVGQGYSDIPVANYPRDNKNIYPIEDVHYINDSRTQYVLFNTREETEIETRALYEKNDIEHINGLLSSNYESSLGTRMRTGINFNDYEEDHEEYDDEDDYDEEHDSAVIDDDIDDYEIINRVLDAFNEREREEREDERN